MKDNKNPIRWMRGWGGQRDAPEEAPPDAEEQQYREQTRLWMQLYRGDCPWKTPDYDKSLNLPALIAAEHARCITLEMQTILQGKDQQQAAQRLLDGLLARLRSDMELACAGGCLLWIPRAGREAELPAVETVTAERLSGMRFDPNGRLTAVTVAHFGEDASGHGCRLSETFRKRPEGGVEITRYAHRTPFPNAPFASLGYGGEPMELSECPEWAALSPCELLEDCSELPLALFRIPGGWPYGSRPYGSAVYARAVNLIRDADWQFSRYQWEFEGGELAIDASEDLFRHTRTGVELPTGKARLYRTNLLDSTSGEPLMQTFSPPLREEPLRRGLTLILTHVEDACSMTRGALSDAGDYYDRTATEIRQSRQRFYGRIAEIQKALTASLNELCRAAASLGLMEENVRLIINYGDSTVEDASDERTRDLAEVQAGVMTREEFRRKYFLGGRNEPLTDNEQPTDNDEQR